MSKKLSFIAAGLLATLSLTTYAAHNGAGGSHMGGMSSQHMSTSGAANTNGPEATDRDKGLDRSEDRRSAQGTAHEKAVASQSVHKHSKPNHP